MTASSNVKQVSLVFEEGVVITTEYTNASRLVKLRSGIDEFIVLKKDEVNEELLKRLSSAPLYSCLTPDELVRGVDNKDRYIVLPYNVRESDTPPQGFFVNLRVHRTLRLREICKVDEGALTKFKKDLVERLAKIDPNIKDAVEHRFTAEDWLALYLEGVKPEYILKLATEVMESSEGADAIPQIYFIVKAIEDILSTIGPFELTTYTAEDITLQGKLATIEVEVEEEMKVLIDLRKGVILVEETAAGDQFKKKLQERSGKKGCH